MKPQPQQPYSIRSFPIGRVSTNEVSDILMQEGSVADAKNVHFDTIGKVKGRPGVTLINSQISDTYSCLGLYYFEASDSTKSQLLTVFSDGTNNDVYYKNSTSWTKTLVDDTKALKTRFTTFLDQVIRVNGTDNATAWTGSGAWSQNAGTSANDLNLDDMDSYDCSLIETFKQRVYMAGNSTSPDRLFFSTIPTSDPYITWNPTDDYVDINPNDGNNITALKRYALDLLIFKTNFIYRYKGISGVDPEPLIKVGTPSQEAVLEAKNGIYFYHANSAAIFKYTGGYPQEISRPVADFLKAIPSTYFTTVNCWTDSDGDHVYYNIGDVTVSGVAWTNVVLRYTISSEAWTVYNYATEMRRGALWNNGTNLVTVAGDDDGNIFTFNSGLKDNATAISMALTTKWHELGRLGQKFVITRLAAISDIAQSFKIEYQIDDDPAWKQIGQLRKYITFYKDKTIEGRRIRFKIFNNSSIAPFSFEGIELLDWELKGIEE